MPASIVNGIITYLTQQLNTTCWDGEIPRQDVSGNPIFPNAPVTSPIDWPVVKVYMQEGGFSREWTFEDPYTDKGEILIQVWGTSRQQLEGSLTNPETGLLNQIEALFAQASNWPQIPLGGPSANPYYVIHMLLTRWYSGQEEGQRTADSSLLYRGDLHYEVMIHGAISTF